MIASTVEAVLERTPRYSSWTQQNTVIYGEAVFQQELRLCAVIAQMVQQWISNMNPAPGIPNSSQPDPEPELFFVIDNQSHCGEVVPVHKPGAGFLKAIYQYSSRLARIKDVLRLNDARSREFFLVIEKLPSVDQNSCGAVGVVTHNDVFWAGRLMKLPRRPVRQLAGWPVPVRVVVSKATELCDPGSTPM